MSKADLLACGVSALTANLADTLASAYAQRGRCMTLGKRLRGVLKGRKGLNRMIRMNRMDQPDFCMVSL